MRTIIELEVSRHDGEPLAISEVRAKIHEIPNRKEPQELSLSPDSDTQMESRWVGAPVVIPLSPKPSEMYEAVGRLLAKKRVLENSV